MSAKNLEVGIYIHIPFCKSKCPYCDFNSYSGQDELIDAYVRAVGEEMAALADRGRDAGTRYVARTLYFGGGTPTLLNPEHFEQLLESAHNNFAWHEGLETTTEANPGTIDAPYIRALRGLGVNRVSLGVQSLDDEMLRGLGRIHNSREAIAAVRACRQAGITNLSLDLMYGLPGQSLRLWRRTLTAAVDLAAEHLSLYPLTVEPDTHYWALQEKGNLIVPVEDVVAEMYEWAETTLATAGYEHYELSNWALIGAQSPWIPPLPNYRCQHNLIYWRNQPYIGVGAGAHSFLHSERYSNERSIANYVRAISERREAVVFREAIARSLEMAETIMLGLRLADGVSRHAFRARFAQNPDDLAGEVVQRARGQGLLIDDGERLALTGRGRLLANEVLAPMVEAISTNSPS